MKIVKSKPVPCGDDRFRYRVVWESDPCLAETHYGVLLKREMLRTLADQPTLAACEYAEWQTMKMKHDGTKWTIEFEAVLAQKQGQAS